MALADDQKVKLLRLSGRSLARMIAHVRSTSKVLIEPDNPEARILANNPFIFAMWHGQFMMLPALHTGQVKVSAMVARHGDAEVIGEALERFDIRLVRGAGAGMRKKDRGGSTALRTALTQLESGTTFAMTADVPPGPARRCGEGIVTLARLSGRPVLPFAAATSRYVALKTWSRMTINMPYGTLAYVIGDPIYVPREADAETIERYRLEIETALNRVTARAYELSGADPARATPPAPRAPGEVEQPGLRLKGYRAVTSALRPVAPALLSYRARQGKEDLARQGERFGIASAPRPSGQVVWVHAASVGETNAILPLITRLLRDRPTLNFVVTTGTVTSAQLSAARLPPQAVHQYVPLDAVPYARRFLDHWRPDLAVFTESDVWPNLILEASGRKIPIALVNGRMSPRSFKRWEKSPSMARPLFGRFAAILAQNETQARNFGELGAPNAIVSGNLKIDSPPPPADPALLAQLRGALNGRPVFVGASTHDGEETILASAHRQLARQIDGLITIIAPRHPERGTSVTGQVKGLGLNVAQRSLNGALPGSGTDVYIADTIGELGTFYALAPVSFVGGSLIDRGGQNPIEAIGHGSAVITGPHWQNFKDTYTALLRHKGALEVRTSDDIAAAVAKLYRDPAALDEMHNGAAAAMRVLGGALERTVAALEPFLAQSSGAARGA